MILFFLKDLLTGAGSVNSGENDNDGSKRGMGENLNFTELVLEAITDVINLMLAGRAPTSVRAALFGASLTAILKNGGGMRPIAVGYV